MTTHQHDFTQGDLSDAVILLAIPMILELGLESVFAVVDMFFVSQLGQNAIATVGLTESVVTIIYSLGIGISTGAAAVVARRVGEKNKIEAAQSAAQSLILTFIISVGIGIVGYIFAKDILIFMGAKAEVVSEGYGFTRIILTANFPILFLFLINGIFRGAGQAAIAMKSLWIASGVNIFLCPLFIHFLGVEGAAIATVVGRSAGVIYQCYHLFFSAGELRLLRSHFKYNFMQIKTLLQIALPATLQFIIGSGSWIILTKLVAESGGTAASAGYQIAFRNFVFFILPAWGLSNAAATLVGQNLGAKNALRAEESIYATTKMSIYMMLAVTIFILLFAHPIVALFTSDVFVLSYGVEALQIIGSGYVFYGIGMVMTQALNGAGDAKTPSWINFFCFWIFQIPIAYWLVNNHNIGTKGAVLVIPLSHAILALISWMSIRRGSWKRIQI